MKQPKSIQISIPQPCTQDWSKMTPQQQGRFCDSCQKCVVDFTGFTDGQLYRFFSEHKGQKVCGRFRSVQLNRQINLPPQPHSTLYKWVLAAGLALVFVAAPETGLFARVPFNFEYQFGYDNDQNPSDEMSVIIISGTVIDENKEPISGAVVTLLRDGVIVTGVSTDTRGQFSFSIVNKVDYTINVKYLGYDAFTMILNHEKLQNRNNITAMLYPQTDGLLGDVIMIEYTPPLLDKYEGGNSKTFLSDYLEQMGH